MVGRNCSNLKFVTDLETKSNRFGFGNEVELKFTLAADFSCLDTLIAKTFVCKDVLTEDKRPERTTEFGEN